MSDEGGSTTANPFDHLDALTRIARGEQAALHQLYQQEGARLLGVVYRIVKDRGMAEDIVHDACLNIWQRADTFDPQKGLPAPGFSALPAIWRLMPCVGVSATSIPT